MSDLAPQPDIEKRLFQVSKFPRQHFWIFWISNKSSYRRWKCHNLKWVRKVPEVHTVGNQKSGFSSSADPLLIQKWFRWSSWFVGCVQAQQADLNLGILQTYAQVFRRLSHKVDILRGVNQSWPRFTKAIKMRSCKHKGQDTFGVLNAGRVFEKCAGPTCRKHPNWLRPERKNMPRYQNDFSENNMEERIWDEITVKWRCESKEDCNTFGRKSHRMISTGPSHAFVFFY